MSDYRKLADRMVALGIIGKSINGYILFVDADGFEYTDEPWNDWRVAGALMEKLENELGLYLDLSRFDKRIDPFAATICEACCDALERDDD